MPKRQTIAAIIHLSRYHDYIFPVPVATLFAFLLANAAINRQNVTTLMIVLLANLMSTGFSFMINDIEDAPDDAINPEKANRNPVSAGRISRNKALFVTITIALLSLVLYAMLGLVPFLLGLLSVVLGGIYSWRRVRLKNMPILDLVSHGFMLGGLIFLITFLSVSPLGGFSLTWIIPLIFIIATSCYGELYNEIRDFEYDKQAGLNHTAVFLGEKNAKLIMFGCLIIAAVAMVLTLILQLIPFTVILAFLVLFVIFGLPHLVSQAPLLKTLQSTKIQDAATYAGVLAATFWLLLHSLLN